MRRADCERERGFTADEGTATLVAAVLSVALLSIAWLGYQIGAVVLSRHRAEGAADLAALAAASQVARGADAACGRAGEVAREMRVRLAECRVDGQDARVRTTAEPAGLPRRWAVVHGRARAGPVTSSTAGPMSPAVGHAPPGDGRTARRSGERSSRSRSPVACAMSGIAPGQRPCARRWRTTTPTFEEQDQRTRRDDRRRQFSAHRHLFCRSSLLNDRSSTQPLPHPASGRSVVV